jgi:hypothetical protein
MWSGVARGNPGDHAHSALLMILTLVLVLAGGLGETQCQTWPGRHCAPKAEMHLLAGAGTSAVVAVFGDGSRLVVGL